MVAFMVFLPPTSVNFLPDIIEPCGVLSWGVFQNASPGPSWTKSKLLSLVAQYPSYTKGTLFGVGYSIREARSPKKRG